MICVYNILLVCKVGKYGLGCINSCVGNCFNKVVCNIIIGNCDVGCVFGYIGDKCNKSM